MIISLAKQIACIQRELNLRKAVYPKWVQKGRMLEIQADYEIEAMTAVLNTLKKLDDQGDLFE